MRESVRSWTRLGLTLAILADLFGCAETPGPSATAPLHSPPRPYAAPLSPIRTIVVDAGHGGHDPGTSHYGLREKHLALDIAKRLRAHLQQAGFTVVMTRETDHFIPLSGRPAVANRLGAELFVSVHLNANHNRNVSGAEVYYPRESLVSGASQWPPSVTASEIGIPSTTIKQVLWDLVLGRTRSQSRRMALTVCRAMREGLGVPCRVPRPARFVVLREAWMPAVLVEVGYVSNRAEATRLGSAAYREAAARAVANGIIAYVRELGLQHI